MSRKSLLIGSSLTCMTLALATVCLPAWAQADAAGAVQRNLMDSAQSPWSARSGKPAAAEAPDRHAQVSLDRLDRLEIQGDRMQADIRAYWKRFMGRSVTAARLTAFKSWFADRAKSQGYLAYVQTQAQGHTLTVTTVVPRLNSIRVSGGSNATVAPHLPALQSRFEAEHPTGMPVDLLALEQKIDAIGFAMPVELDVIMRAAGPESLDVTVNAVEAADRSGQLLGGLVLVNNGGLSQFGRAQVLGQLSVGGHAPTARFTLTGQKSEGITYARAEYDMPYSPLGLRTRMSLGGSRSESIRASASTRSVGRSSDLGWGLDKVLGYHRETLFKGSADLLLRQTHSDHVLTAEPISRIHDRQLRLKLAADSDKLSSEPMRVELTGVIGDYTTLLQLPNIPSGQYAKLEFSARKQLNLSDDGQVYGLARLRGQRTSHHVDGYNQISLGGSSGVRAYTSADGVGDDGMVSSLELNIRTRPTEIFGLFYDAGLVRAAKKPLSGIYPGTYSLQAWGYQIVGSVRNFHYSWVIAKGVNGNKGALPSDLDSSPNNWRLSVSAAYWF